MPNDCVAAWTALGSLGSARRGGLRSGWQGIKDFEKKLADSNPQRALGPGYIPVAAEFAAVFGEYAYQLEPKSLMQGR